MADYKLATAEDIKLTMENLIKWWGAETAEKVIVACFYENPFNGSFDDFLKHCTMCGGNWGGMLLTGIKKLYPKVWDVIPDNMGINAFASLLDVLLLLGVYVICPDEEGE